MCVTVGFSWCLVRILFSMCFEYSSGWDIFDYWEENKHSEYSKSVDYLAMYGLTNEA